MQLTHGTAAALEAAAPDLSPPTQNSQPAADRLLPSEVAQTVWRASELGRAPAAVLSSGFDALDAELPSGGWPCNGLTEILAAQYSVLEWRLLAPVLRAVSQAGRTIVLVGPPKPPYPPGLRQDGTDERQLLWIDVDKPAERLWSTEQAIRSNGCGAVLAWLPQVRNEQIRRLQSLASGCDAPTFIFRPSSAAADSSAAPLRVLASVAEDWELTVQILKRKGSPFEGVLRLPSIPGSLKSIMTPRLRYPSRLTSRVPDHVVVSPAPARPRRQAISQ